ncbi:hypothetical protein [Streptomyces sp. NPDC014894]|uniref:hypothetical protein n=1 Tax=Streptomyces sp. NPDC014894 TaxID=3364931 RepID=UPI0036FA0126
MAEGNATGHGTPAAPPPLPAVPPGDLPGLLALLGRLLESHAPAEVAVLLHEEIDRREIAAYADGWADAAAEYGPALEEARAAALARPLRLVGRTPGQAAVIPFPRDEQGLPYEGRGRAEGPGQESGEPPAAPGGQESRRAAEAREEPRRPPAEPPDPEAPAPALVPKNRKSKVPTIPRLPGARRARRDTSSGAGEPPDGHSR